MNTLKRFTQDHKIMKPKSEPESEFICRVKPLLENEPPLEIKVSHENSGQWLLDEVCERLGGIQEKDYFGLRYSDKEKQRQWIDLSRNIYSQLKDTYPFLVSFRIKHYPGVPLDDLREDKACYFLYLQLRRDLYSGRLIGRSNDLYQLAAYAVQSEVGDFDSQNEDTRYLSSIKLLPNLNSKTEAKITDIHKNLNGLTADEVEQKFLEKASQLDTYGVEPFYVKDQKGNNLYVGLTHEGVSTFQGSRRAHLFKWCDIAKIHYQGKLFILHVLLDEIYNNQQIKKKHVLGFKCDTEFSAFALWKWANDRMCFFSLNRSSEAKRVKSGGGIFRKRKTFKFAGRCQKEMQQQSISMLHINNTGASGFSRRGTILRDAVQEEDVNDESKTKYNTMPSREKGKMLGTQDTLDSLFMPNHHGSTDSTTIHSPINSPMGSPKTSDHKSPETHRTQSLGHILEEPCNIIPENKEYQKLNLLDDQKSNHSKTSSMVSSSRTINDNMDMTLNNKLSSSNVDIVSALEQLQIAVTDATVKKESRRGRILGQCLCLGCLLILGLLLTIIVATLLILIGIHYHNNSDVSGVSQFLTDIVTKPHETANLFNSEHLSRFARKSYSVFYQYVISDSHSHQGQ